MMAPPHSWVRGALPIVLHHLCTASPLLYSHETGYYFLIIKFNLLFYQAVSISLTLFYNARNDNPILVTVSKMSSFTVKFQYLRIDDEKLNSNTNTCIVECLSRPFTGTGETIQSCKPLLVCKTYHLITVCSDLPCKSVIHTSWYRVFADFISDFI